jgi:hypothetical protein
MATVNLVDKARAAVSGQEAQGRGLSRSLQPHEDQLFRLPRPRLWV